MFVTKSISDMVGHNIRHDQCERKEMFKQNGSVASLKSQTPMTPTKTVHQSNDFTLERKASLPRKTSYGNLASAAEAKVLVIYTGGTIGMMRNDKNGK